MTARRRRMLEGLRLRGVSERTPDMDVRAVRQLAEHDRQSPDVSSAEARRHYFLDVKHVQPDSRRASTIARCGIQCCCEQTLHRDWTTWRCVRAPRAPKLPVLRRLEAVRRRLDGVSWPRDRGCLTTIDAGGLRRQEGTPLQGPALERSRRLSHVRPGQGGNERDVPWPHRTRARRRQ